MVAGDSGLSGHPVLSSAEMEIKRDHVNVTFLCRTTEVKIARRMGHLEKKQKDVGCGVALKVCLRHVRVYNINVTIYFL